MKKIVFLLILFNLQLHANSNCLNEDEKEFLHDLISNNTQKLQELGWTFDNDFSKWKGLVLKDCSIIEIDLSSIDIDRVPNTIAYAKNIEVIKINVGKDISRNLFSLPKLKTVHLESYSINKFLPFFHRLKNLKALKINAYLDTFPKQILQLTNLQYLDLSNNSIENIPEEIINLKHLNHLDLSQNNTLSGNLQFYSTLENLTYLNLENTDMAGSFTCTSKNLRYLNLSNIYMKYETIDFSKISNLEVLKLKNTKLKNITGLKNQKSLKIIDLSDNYLYNTNEITFGLSKQLDSVNLSKNELSKIPDFGKAPTYLNLSSNPIFSFTNKDFKNLSEVVSLDISHMAIETIPMDIKFLKTCETLNLSNNSLETLPEAISECKNIKDLNLSYNKIQALPKTLGKLDDLSILNLKNNQLTEFTIVLPNLKQLNLFTNNFSKIPYSIFKSKNIETFYINGFDLNKVPAQFLDLKSLKKIQIPFEGQYDDILCKLDKKGVNIDYIYVQCKN